MFDIEYKGGNAVVITTKKNVLVADPKLSLFGLKDLAPVEAIEVLTEARFKSSNTKTRLLIEGPGEYEVGDFSLRGVAAIRHIDTESDEPISTMYRIEVGDVRIALLGNVADKITEDQFEALGVVDVVILPVGGGGYTLDPTSAASIVRQIDPKAVVPVHYSDTGLKYEVPQEGLETFVKELGAPVETVSKLKVKSASALPQVLTVIEVTRS